MSIELEPPVTEDDTKPYLPEDTKQHIVIEEPPITEDDTKKLEILSVRPRGRD